MICYNVSDKSDYSGNEKSNRFDYKFKLIAEMQKKMSKKRRNCELK